MVFIVVDLVYRGLQRATEGYKVLPGVEHPFRSKRISLGSMIIFRPLVVYQRL